MASSLEGFEKYIQFLATGKLDVFMDSIRHEDKYVDLEDVASLPLDPNLLLHDLGGNPDQEKINKLFTGYNVRGVTYIYGSNWI